ncbi:MAG: type IV secretory system conjugative DNA transfer family protein [Clostridiales bacterium]
MNNVLGGKKSKFKLYLLFVIFLIIILEYISLKYSMVAIEYKKENIIEIVSKLFENIEKNALDINFNDDVKNYFMKMQLFVIGAIAFILLLASTSSMKKGEFSGSEYGSATWAKADDLKKFKKNKKGIILGENLYMDYTSKEYNLNQFIIGGPGSGKTFRKIKPDVMQANTNYVITDSKGEIFRDTSNYLRSKGYKIKVLNLIVPEYSMGFNPFKYIKDDKDVLILVDTFINNTESDKSKQSTSNEGFWIKAETALMQALVFYVWKELPDYEWNFNTLLKLLLYASQDFTEEAATESLVILDKIFNDLSIENDRHEAVNCYKIFKLSGGQTSTSIMIGLAVRFSIFISKDVESLTREDEMELDLFANKDEKIALYIMISDSHRTFDVISAMFFSQLFQFLIYKADFEKGGSLDNHCRVLMDEFINIGFIPYFDTFLSTIRSRNISSTIILQEITQLKTKYKDNWETIIGCCDTIIYLGSPANETREYLSKILGKTTVQQNNRSMNFGSKGGRSESVNNIQRDLLTPDELRVIGDEKQVVIIRALKPIYLDKFKTEKKNYYKNLSDKADYKEVIKDEEELDFSKNIDIFEELEKSSDLI